MISTSHDLGSDFERESEYYPLSESELSDTIIQMHE